MAENSGLAEQKEITKIGLFLGCIIPTEQYAYELSLRKILPILGVDIIDLEGASCCGAPLRSINLNLTMYLSLRNLAICEHAGLDLLAPCPICHLALTEAKNFFTDSGSSEEIERYRSMLAEEGLEFIGNVEIYHILDMLHDVIGLDKIRDNVRVQLSDIEFACHYGCHLIRPTQTNRPDHAEHPVKLDNILKALGASSKDYPEKLNCCGGPLILNLPDSALTKTGQKLKAVQDHGFTGLVDMCPWGHRLLDARQKNAADTVGEKLDVPVFYLTQLIGLAFGIDAEDLGLHLNLSPVDKLDELKLQSQESNESGVESRETQDTTDTQETRKQPEAEGGD